ncbi:hypothetical protein LAC81_30135 [Ensifer adhaerens]|uniref:hypothetical protein n=1 Tax=Ensifer adhaerens TaxID=106592 RepID=UPI001CBEB62C|nr:hypothetical protein [Ensifer adhaerens]UAX95796.1 hypothetical protein LAC78_33695 [Ensifer adhaerens]UAY04863.1 hypothetical protein LAC80_26615 [Ensifer adhaerens]UAY10295.1 hypothetical protein LAC81_30135 [Ensifer adhaerens]
MRASIKTFVVEVKRNRRLAKPRVDSIWGDIDLRSAAREVIGFDYVDSGREIFNTGEETSLEVKGETEKSQVLASDVPEFAAELYDADDPIENVVARKPPRRSPRKKKAFREQDQGKLLRVADDEPDATRPTFADLESLAVLEAENAHLKTLWAEQLRRENEQLSIMLSRVSFASVHLPD